ncbi:EAL domain-containing protein [Roseateles sp. BYS87W]|uniref:EAL domain-containing protein n=1 Tax=Pelomonas baiyunensis TaxID=3299026 RepID=A0ABW7H1I6_9BURK
MIPAALPPDEAARLAALHQLGVLDTPAEAAFDALTAAAAALCGVPIALVSLVDGQRQWFKARVGLTADETPREQAFCAHTILGTEVFEVADALLDPRFAGNPLVTGEPGIRFYAGAPVRLAGGAAVGTVCVIDRVPRHLTATQREALAQLATAAAALLDLRRDAHTLAKSEARYRALAELSPVGLFAGDAHGDCTYTNPCWQEIHGLTLERSLGLGWMQSVEAAELARLGRAWEQAVQSRGLFDEVMTVRRTDGTVRAVRSRSAPQFDAQGRMTGFVGLAEDVTEARTQQERLLDERQYLASVIESTGVGTWEWHVPSGAMRINERWADILGYRLEELEPLSLQTWQRLVDPDDLPQAQAAVQRHLSGETPQYRCEFRMRHKAGHWVSVLAVGRVLTRSADGAPEWAFGTHLDFSEQVRDREAALQAHRRMELALEGGAVGLWEYDLARNTLSWQRGLFGLYGLPEDTARLEYTEWLALLHPDDRPRVQAELQEVLAGHRGYDMHFRVLRQDGSVRHMHSMARARLDARGRIAGLLGATWDNTELQELGAELAEQHELMRVTLKSIADGVITTDAAGCVTWLNPAAERKTGWTAAEALGRPLSEVFVLRSEETHALVASPVEACLAGAEAGPSHPLAVLHGRQGERFGIEDSAAPIRNAQGRLLGAVLVFHDVTEQRRLSSEMTYRAKHDALTGLVNRQEFEARLRRALEQTRHEPVCHTLLFIDLDQFKLVNDACGHPVGDLLLKQVAQLIGGVVRSRDTLARLGGDEFAALMEQCTREQALRVAQQICDRMDAFRFVHDGRRFRIGASIGLVQVDARWPDLSDLLKAADAACYAAKEAGRNRVHTWYESDRMILERSGDMQWATRLAQALDEDRMVLFGQRLQPLGAQPEGLHLEALVRMRQPDGSLTLPGSFMPATERFGLAPRLDRWVVREALAWLDAHGTGCGLASLHVNLSAQSLADATFRADIVRLLEQAGEATCEALCFEITETVALANLGELALFVDRVRECGARVAVDDFGAGASHFGYLRSLKVDLIKVDGQFIKGMLRDPLDDASVRGFLEVARVLGVQTVAEFVDEPAVLNRVRDLGFDYAQGFHIARPEPLTPCMAS